MDFQNEKLENIEEKKPGKKVEGGLSYMEI